MRRLLLIACLALAAPAALAPAAGAQSFRGILEDYAADGQITPCRFSAQELNGFLNAAPGDTEQYAPGLLDQIRAALQAQAGGGCDRGGSGGGERPRQTEQQPAPAAPAPPPPSAPQPRRVVKVEEPPAPEPPRREDAIEGSKVPAPPVVAARPAGGGGEAPAPLWALAALGGLTLLAGAAALVAWFFGWSAERLTAPLAAAAAEAQGRGADLAAEFADWLRFGR
jgi:hypothetical protein